MKEIFEKAGFREITNNELRDSSLVYDELIEYFDKNSWRFFIRCAPLLVE